MERLTVVVKDHESWRRNKSNRLRFNPLHPRRHRGSQWGRGKRRSESFQVRTKEPLGIDSRRTICINSSGYRLLIGHKKCLYYCAQSANTSSLVLFVCSYTTAICLDHSLSGSCTKEMQAVRKLFDIKSPSDFKILSPRTIKTLFEKYKLQLTTGIHACIGHVLRKYIFDSRENVPWKREFIVFQSLS